MYVIYIHTHSCTDWYIIVCRKEKKEGISVEKDRMQVIDSLVMNEDIKLIFFCFDLHVDLSGFGGI